MKGPRVLLSAYQCGPGMGSVSQIGWEWYSRLAEQIPVTLVTHTRNRAALQKAGAPVNNSEIVYIDTEWFAGPLFRLASMLFPKSQHSVFLVSSLDFYFYDTMSYRRFRSAPFGTWDIVHSVTPVSPLAATKLFKLQIPLLVGPWNGGLPSPRTFPEIMAEDSAWLYRIRSIGQIIDRLVGCTRNAARILVATRATEESLPPECGPRVRRIVENGVDLNIFHPGEPLPAPSPSNPLKVLFVGRLVPFKAVSLLFDAVERVHAFQPIELTVVGDGPLEQTLRTDAQNRNLPVYFTASLPLEAVAEKMRGSHVFCLPSVRESGGAVLLEAMASGLPVIAVNYGGPAEIVDAEVGKLLSADGREALVNDIVDAFQDIVRRPEIWKQKGRSGRQRAERQYTWNAKISSAISMYRELSGGNFSDIQPSEKVAHA